MPVELTCRYIWQRSSQSGCLCNSNPFRISFFQVEIREGLFSLLAVENNSVDEVLCGKRRSNEKEYNRAADNLLQAFTVISFLYEDSWTLIFWWFIDTVWHIALCKRFITSVTNEHYVQWVTHINSLYIMSDRLKTILKILFPITLIPRNIFI